MSDEDNGPKGDELFGVCVCARIKVSTFSTVVAARRMCPGGRNHIRCTLEYVQGL